MGTTTEGARKAVLTKKQKYGIDHFESQGRKGGAARNRSGRAYKAFEDRALASEAGKKGAQKRWGTKEPVAQ